MTRYDQLNDPDLNLSSMLLQPLLSLVASITTITDTRRFFPSTLNAVYRRHNIVLHRMRYIDSFMTGDPCKVPTMETRLFSHHAPPARVCSRLHTFEALPTHIDENAIESCGEIIRFCCQFSGPMGLLGNSLFDTSNRS